MSQLKARVVMLGDSLKHNGGIVTVEKLILKYAPPDIEIQHIGTREDGSITHKVMVFGKGLGALVWRLLSRRTELVHIHLADGGSALRKAIITLIALVFRKPVLMHAHGPEFHLTYFGLPKWAQKGLSWIFQRCWGFIVLSKSWKDFYVLNCGLNAEQVFVLPNPVELPEQVPNRINATKVRLVFFGRVGQRKGAFDLIRAFANLPAEQKDCSELILAGDGEVEQGRRLVESLNLIDRITFLGWVNSEQRDALLAKADVFVLPSYNEGLPMALLEAMGCGLPAIATPVGGIPELVTSGENGLLVTPGDIQQLSEAMQSLIENESLRLSFGSVARASVSVFDVKNYMAKLINIYCSSLEHNRQL
jgi:glycosyltransferase involved in cell wall biosynthesis